MRNQLSDMMDKQMEFVEYAIARWDEDGYLNTPVRG
jgi:hypothetical protein